MRTLVVAASERGKNYKTFKIILSKSTVLILEIFRQMFLWWPSTKFVPIILIRGRACFPYMCIHSENLKNFLVQMYRHDLKMIWYKCFLGYPLQRLFTLFWSCFSLYVYIHVYSENLKIFLSKRNGLIQIIPIRSKTCLPGGGACYTLICMYSETLTYVLVQTYRPDF